MKENQRERERGERGTFCSATAIDKSDGSNGCVGMSVGQGEGRDAEKSEKGPTVCKDR